MAKALQRISHKAPKRSRKKRMTLREMLYKKHSRYRKHPTVTISKQEYDGLKETIYLLSNPTNARELLAAIADANAGKLEEHELLDE